LLEQEFEAVNPNLEPGNITRQEEEPIERALREPQHVTVHS
jgi:hypothetical protein